MTTGMRCEHIGISRYLRRFKTPTDYGDVEAALLVNELNWNPAEFDHYLPRNEIAKGTLYTSDCSVEMFQRLEKEAESLQQVMFNAGILLRNNYDWLVLAIDGSRSPSLSDCEERGATHRVSRERCKQKGGRAVGSNK
ncbi:hypothetical protein ANCDUO_00364 [Ancylostoma duodenale]|uniref:Uncharacterized protein n=1 Tax=Ancylostoma duodenale TaxID=51022 RepID=A0A0C2HI20_9BILA|nr:hypothetical protein ANCDUO_00364 [Ancylostoma duodenale]